MDVYRFDDPDVDADTCNKQDNQMWTWNATDETVRSKHNDECLTVQPEREVWSGPLSSGSQSQAVVLFNRGDSGSEQNTVQWTDIAFPSDHPGVVRD